MTKLKSSIHNSPPPSLEDERYNEIEGINYTAGYVKQLSSDDELLAGAWGMKDTTEIWDLCYRSGPRMTKILEDFLFGWSQDMSYISIFDDTEPPKVDWDKVTMSNVIGITAIWTLHEMARIKPAMFRHTYQYIPGERNPFKLDPYDLLHGIMLLRWVLRTWNFDRDQQPDRPRPLRAKERRFWRPKARAISFAPLPEPEDSEMMDVD
ncbi:hypothetical protein ACMYSQ_009763 [Aspergillus niger]